MTTRPRYLLVTADDFGVGPETSRGFADGGNVASAPVPFGLRGGGGG